MKQSRKIELLAPARDCETGVAAVNHGADAVYIGAPRFGARQAAGNSLDDIGRLVRYAHRYDARVYVALNTLLKDDELDEARRIAVSLYEIGADALIVQDMALLEMELPPIALHASTQTDNRTVEKVRFLESVGFSQVVLARELSLRQIAEIAAGVTVPLEVFVHGALCVGYSGQCYVSECLSGRSANRGACAQYCRLPYTLTDGEGRVLHRDKHLLSLRDLHLGDDLEALLDAGVASFKIEGRLKEPDYVKNCTAYYRKRLDALFRKRGEYAAASSGTCRFAFEPKPEKSFNRRFTRYFFDGGTAPMASFDTPKSVGAFVGNVREVSGRNFTLTGPEPVHNGDGLCYTDESGRFTGFSVNRVEGNRLFPAEMPALSPNTPLYRNRDLLFEKELANPRSGERRMALDLHLFETEETITLQLTDETGRQTVCTREVPPEQARTPQRAYLEQQLARLGETPFAARAIRIDLPEGRFVPASALAALRREAVEKLLSERAAAYRPALRENASNPLPCPETKLTYLGNVSNRLARRFYERHGVTRIDPAFELAPDKKAPLLFTRYCLKRETGCCPKEKGPIAPPEPWRLHYKDTTLRLRFDCGRCGMEIFLDAPGA